MVLLRLATPVTISLTAVPVVKQVSPASISPTPITPYAFLEEAPKTATQLAIAHCAATQIATVSGGQANSNMKNLARGVAYEDQDVTVLARIMLPSTGPMLQADMSGTATLNIYHLSSDTPDTYVIQTTSIGAASVIFDALQVDTYWTTDDQGYNFQHTQASAAGKLEGGRVYRFEYSFDTDNDGITYVIAEVAVQGLYST